MIIVTDKKIGLGIFGQTRFVRTNIDGTKFVYSHNFKQSDLDIALSRNPLVRIYYDDEDWQKAEGWINKPFNGEVVAKRLIKKAPTTIRSFKTTLKLRNIWVTRSVKQKAVFCGLLLIITALIYLYLKI